MLNVIQRQRQFKSMTPRKSQTVESSQRVTLSNQADNRTLVEAPPLSPFISSPTGRGLFGLKNKRLRTQKDNHGDTRKFRF